MTAVPQEFDPEQFLHEQLAQGQSRLDAEHAAVLVNAVLSHQADAICGAGYCARTGERVSRRNETGTVT